MAEQRCKVCGLTKPLKDFRGTQKTCKRCREVVRIKQDVCRLKRGRARIDGLLARRMERLAQLEGAAR